MCRGSTDQEEDTGGPIVTLVLGITVVAPGTVWQQRYATQSACSVVGILCEDDIFTIL